ncbi:MAG: hypothetical protein IJH05_10185 [Firmicutes bacterium]|nr:hypothetical protein [Bacillota bacterium]
MEKEKNTSNAAGTSSASSAAKSLAVAGAATAFAGVALYAVGQVLSFLFRDVDPKRAEKEKEEE